tara:strand:- start:296 stop:781 length:486 start_codon:yes stop_codon:yes gene_type:complete
MEQRVDELDTRLIKGLEQEAAQLERTAALSKDVEDGMRRLRQELAELGVVREGLCEAVASSIEERVVQSVEDQVNRLAKGVEHTQRLGGEMEGLSKDMAVMRREVTGLSSACKKVHEADLTMSQTVDKVAKLSAERDQLKAENEKMARIVSHRRHRNPQRG